MLLNHSIQQSFTQHNIKLVCITIPQYPVSSSSVWINAGSRYDSLSTLGISHFIEHLLFTKMKSFPNRIEMLRSIEEKGMYFNAFTTLQSQHYYYVHNHEHSLFALKLLIEGLVNSQVHEDFFISEKDVVLNEELQNHMDPSSYIWRLANKGIWHEKKLGKDFYGTRDSIMNISLKDIEVFMSKYVTNKNITFVCINSSLKINEILDYINAINLPDKNKTDESFEYNQVNKKVVYEKMDLGESIQLSISILGPKITDNKEKITQDLISSSLSGGWSSSFIQELRIDNNLIYWMYPDCVALTDTGYQRYSTNITRSNLQELLPRILEIVNTPISEKNLIIHKNKLVSDTIRNATDYSWLINWYGYNALLSSNLQTIDEYILYLHQITVNDLNHFRSNYMTRNKISFAYLGKQEESVFQILL